MGIFAECGRTSFGMGGLPSSYRKGPLRVSVLITDLRAKPFGMSIITTRPYDCRVSLSV